MGGGIILDAIHEIDYAKWFFGKAEKVSCFSGKMSSLEIDTEDYAEILIQFENNVVAVLKSNNVGGDCIEEGNF